MDFSLVSIAFAFAPAVLGGVVLLDDLCPVIGSAMIGYSSCYDVLPTWGAGAANSTYLCRFGFSSLTSIFLV